MLNGYEFYNGIENDIVGKREIYRFLNNSNNKGKLCNLLKDIIKQSKLNPYPGGGHYNIFITTDGFDYMLTDNNVYMYEDSSLFNAFTGEFIFKPSYDLKLLLRVPADLGSSLGDIANISNQDKEEVQTILNLINNTLNIQSNLTWDVIQKYKADTYIKYLDLYLERSSIELIDAIYLNYSYENNDEDKNIQAVPF